MEPGVTRLSVAIGFDKASRNNQLQTVAFGQLGWHPRSRGQPPGPALCPRLSTGVEAVWAFQMFPDVSGNAKETFGYKSEGHSGLGLCCNASTVELLGCREWNGFVSRARTSRQSPGRKRGQELISINVVGSRACHRCCHRSERGRRRMHRPAWRRALDVCRADDQHGGSPFDVIDLTPTTVAAYRQPPTPDKPTTTNSALSAAQRLTVELGDSRRSASSNATAATSSRPFRARAPISASSA